MDGTDRHAGSEKLNSLPGCLFIIIFFLVSCGPDVAVDEIPGTYVANIGFGVDTLVLRPEGTYSQKLMFNGSDSAFTTTGKWKYDPAIEYLSIENMILIDSVDGKARPESRKPSNGIALLPMVRSLLKRRLSIGSEETMPYYKIE